MTTRIAVGMVFLSSVLLGASPAKSLYPDPSLPIVRSLSNRLAFLPSISQSVDSVGEIDVTLPGYKYPGKAMLYSLVVPGGGQLYAGRPKRTLFFLGAEVLAIATWSSYNRRGENKTLAYKDSADVHWDFRRWLLTAPTYVPPIWGTETESGQIYVGTQGTHHLEFFVDMDGDNRPEVYGNSKDHSERLYQLLADPDTSDYLYIKKSHEYYENIGKYNEFFSGWDDADPNNPDIEERKSGLIALSDHRSKYLHLRAEANRLKSVGSYAISALMFNHVISAVDAIFATSKWNREHARRLSGRLWYSPVSRLGIGGVQISLAW